MHVKLYHNIRSIRKIYMNLSEKSGPLQQYHVVKRIFSFCYWIEPLFYNLKKFRSYVFYVVYDEEIPVLIVPCTTTKDETFIMGGKEWDYVDLVYSTDKISYLKEAFTAWFNYLKSNGIRKIHWFYLGEDALSYKVLQEMNGDVICTNFLPEKNVKILFPNERAEYFNKLSKSVRQNCRTAYNRTKRDEKKCQVNVFCANEGEGLRDNNEAYATYKKCMKLYLKRQRNRYHTPLRYMLRIKYYDYFTKSVVDKDGFISTLSIDGELAAFMMGFLDRTRKSIIIPRLAIDDTYCFYSPGLYLINETIGYLINETDFRCLDLCDGDEKYKYDMGGTEYLTYKMVITLV